ncbi:MAG: SGNH/GDSL hydrolase family protein [Oscillospiraceae bacterium]|nr:SGNH/GDSL hydrolase family protein [Oscillospiraceae bacterium]
MEIKNGLQALRAALPGKTQLKIGVWGDSVFQGVVLDELAGKYKILKENAVSMCSDALKATVENFSKFGCTVTKGKQRMLLHLDKGKHSDIVILEYGGNDCDMPWAEISAQPEFLHQPKVPLKDFSVHIQEIIDTLISHGIVPLLTTLPPLHHERYLNWICRNGLSRENILRFLGDSHRIYTHHERYSLELSQLAMDNNCRIIDIRSAFLDYGDYGELICTDGIHPNDRGQALIRETIMKFADKYLPTMILQPAPSPA